MVQQSDANDRFSLMRRVVGAVMKVSLVTFRRKNDVSGSVAKGGSQSKPRRGPAELCGA